MDWIDLSTFEDFCQRQVERIHDTLFRFDEQTKAGRPYGYRPPRYYTREELIIHGHLEVRAMKGGAKTTAQMVKDMGKDAPTKGEPCPKCGSTKGWVGPHYERAQKVVTYDRRHPSKVKKVITDVEESLVWVCRVCGYTRHVPTKDATP